MDGNSMPQTPQVPTSGGDGAFRRLLGGIGKVAGSMMTNKYGGGVKQGYEAGRELGEDVTDTSQEDEIRVQALLEKARRGKYGMKPPVAPQGPEIPGNPTTGPF